MSLLKTSLLNGIAVCVRMGAGLVLNKIFAVHVGPSGFAAIGQLQNFIAMVTTFAAGAVNTGVTKYAAEYHDDPERKSQLFRTAGTVTVIGSVIACVLLIGFRNYLNRWLFGETDYTEALVWMGICLVFISLNALLLAVLAGQKEVRRYVTANICSSLVGLLVSGGLAWYMGLKGALIALSLAQAVSLVTTWLACRTLPWCRVDVLWGKIDKATFALLGRFVAMALVSAAVVPVTQMLIRSTLILNFDAAHAGYWDAMNKISAIYLALVTTTLSLYYLPRISEIKDDRLLIGEIKNTFKLVVPATALFALSIYLFRDLLIKILFSTDFRGVTELVGWQMVGDVIKISSWLLAYVLVGKAMMKLFIITEIFFSLTLYFLTTYAVKNFGFQGVSVAYAVNYFLYFLAMYFIVVEWRLKRFKSE